MADLYVPIWSLEPLTCLDGSGRRTMLPLAGTGSRAAPGYADDTLGLPHLDVTLRHTGVYA